MMRKSSLDNIYYPNVGLLSDNSQCCRPENRQKERKMDKNEVLLKDVFTMYVNAQNEVKAVWSEFKKSADQREIGFN